MEIFTNWMFWVVLAGVVFIFAMIGFLVENKKKNGKESKKQVNPIDNKDNTLNQNITKAPEGNTINLDEVKTVSEDSFSKMPEVNVQAMPQPVESPQPVQTPVEPAPAPQPVQTPVEPVTEPEKQTSEPQNETISESQNQTVESANPNNLPDIAEEVTQEAATLFDNDDDSDVWKV